MEDIKENALRKNVAEKGVCCHTLLPLTIFKLQLFDQLHFILSSSGTLLGILIRVHSCTRTEFLSLSV